MKKISLFTPCYNEIGNVKTLYEQVTEVMKQLPEYTYDYTFIDNKSTDGTREVLKDIAKKDRRVKLIFNIKNFGPDKSGLHGFLQTDGDASICFACDLQDPPELIPEFIKSWEAGCKVVWGQKVSSQENKFMYGVRSLYYKLIKIFSEEKQYDQVTGFGLYDKEVMHQIRKVIEPDLLLRNVVLGYGYEVGIIQYQQPKRNTGKSHYNFFSYFDTAIKSMIFLSQKPLRIITYLGILFSIVSFLLFLGCIIVRYASIDISFVDISPIYMGVFFMGSIQILFLGIIGEYINVICKKLSNREHVIEEERINF